MNQNNAIPRALLITATALYWILILATACFVFVVFLKVAGLGVNANARIKSMIDGQAFRPYVYRVLLPATADFLSPIIRRRAALQIGATFDRALNDRIFFEHLNGRAYPSQVVLILVMMYVSLVVFCIAMWHLLGMLGYSLQVKYVVPPLMLLGGIVFFIRHGYIYDFTALALFTLGLLAMITQDWLLFLPVFALATLNKETSILLSLIYALYFARRLPRRVFMTVLATQLGIFGVIQGYIRFLYRNNPGGAVEWHVLDQFQTLEDFAQRMPYVLVVGWVVTIIMAALMWRQWSKKPPFARVAFIVLPILLVLFMLWGYPLEIRVLLEAYPVIVVLMLPPPDLSSTARPEQ